MKAWTVLPCVVMFAVPLLVAVPCLAEITNAAAHFLTVRGSWPKARCKALRDQPAFARRPTSILYCRASREQPIRSSSAVPRNTRTLSELSESTRCRSVATPLPPLRTSCTFMAVSSAGIGSGLRLDRTADSPLFTHDPPRIRAFRLSPQARSGGPSPRRSSRAQGAGAQDKRAA